VPIKTYPSPPFPVILLIKQLIINLQKVETEAKPDLFGGVTTAFEEDVISRSARLERQFALVP